jgi:NAD(P)H-dependent FMN reductase
MEAKMNIVVLASTTRKERKSIHAAKLVAEIGREFVGITIIFVDVLDYFPLPGEGNDAESKDSRWVEINKNADGYFIVAPEYNHSFPGSLKMLLDNDLGNYTHKPVNLAGVSSGPFGGVRMIESMLGPLRGMGLVVTFSDVYFPFVQDMFAENENSIRKIEEQKERIRKAYKELIWMAKTLKWGRDNLSTNTST